MTDQQAKFWLLLWLTSLPAGICAAVAVDLPTWGRIAAGTGVAVFFHLRFRDEIRAMGKD